MPRKKYQTKKRYQYGRRRIYKSKRRKSFLHGPFFWFFILLLLILTGIGDLVICSNFFEVKSIEISGHEKISPEEIIRTLEEKIEHKIVFFESKSVFLFRSSDLIKAISKKYPGIEKTTIKRRFPSGLTVEIKERQPAALFCQNDQCLYVDKNGVIFQEENVENAGKLLILRPENAITDIFLGKVVINKEQFDLLIKITDAISGNLQIPTKELLIQNESQNITEDIDRSKVKTQEGWDIYFDLKNNVDWQIIKLSSVLEKEIPQEKRGDLEYVDLRIGNFAPYKYRDRE